MISVHLQVVRYIKIKSMFLVFLFSWHLQNQRCQRIFTEVKLVPPLLKKSDSGRV